MPPWNLERFAHLLGFFSLLVSGLTSAVQDSFLCEALGFPQGFGLPWHYDFTALMSIVTQPFSLCLSSSEMELDLFN